MISYKGTFVLSWECEGATLVANISNRLVLTGAACLFSVWLKDGKALVVYFFVFGESSKSSKLPVPVETFVAGLGWFKLVPV